MKIYALALLVMGLAASWTAGAQHVEGNYGIRFEPTAKLQTGPPIPFQILVKDSLRKPLVHAKVTLQIAEEGDTRSVRVFPAVEVEPGTYIAKPSFSAAGKWNIYVEATRQDHMSARTIQFQVSD